MNNQMVANKQVLLNGKNMSGKKIIEVRVNEVNKPNIKHWAKLLLQMEQNGTLLKE